MSDSKRAPKVNPEEMRKIFDDFDKVSRKADNTTLSNLVGLIASNKDKSVTDYIEGIDGETFARINSLHLKLKRLGNTHQTKDLEDARVFLEKITKEWQRIQVQRAEEIEELDLSYEEDTDLKELEEDDDDDDDEIKTKTLEGLDLAESFDALIENDEFAIAQQLEIAIETAKETNGLKASLIKSIEKYEASNIMLDSKMIKKINAWQRKIDSTEIKIRADDKTDILSELERLKSKFTKSPLEKLFNELDGKRTAKKPEKKAEKEKIIIKYLKNLYLHSHDKTVDRKSLNRAIVKYQIESGLTNSKMIARLGEWRTMMIDSGRGSTLKGESDLLQSSFQKDLDDVLKNMIQLQRAIETKKGQLLTGMMKNLTHLSADTTPLQLFEAIDSFDWSPEKIRQIRSGIANANARELAELESSLMIVQAKYQYTTTELVQQIGKLKSIVALNFPHDSDVKQFNKNLDNALENIKKKQPAKSIPPAPQSSLAGRIQVCDETLASLENDLKRIVENVYRDLYKDELDKLGYSSGELYPGELYSGEYRTPHPELTAELAKTRIFSANLASLYRDENSELYKFKYRPDFKPILENYMAVAAVREKLVQPDKEPARCLEDSERELNNQKKRFSDYPIVTSARDKIIDFLYQYSLGRKFLNIVYPTKAKQFFTEMKSRAVPTVKKVSDLNNDSKRAPKQKH
jgi:hypothetical protein